MKAHKITNPLWLGQIAPRIEAFIKKMDIACFSYPAFFTYLQGCIQYGGNHSEVWVVFDDANEPVAIMHFFVKGLPYVGVVCCDFVYSWTPNKEPFQLLADEYIEFGKRSRCLFYEGCAINDRVYKIISKAFDDRGYDLKNTGIINFLGRKK